MNAALLDVLVLILLGFLILVVVTCTLLIPLVVTISAEKNEKRVFFASKVSWGLISIFLSQELNQRVVSFLIRNHTIYQKILRTPVLQSRAVFSSKSFTGFKIKTVIIGLKRILPNLKTLLGYLSKAISIHSIMCDIKIGFPSASTTGVLYGYYWAIRSFLTPFRQISLNMAPVFDHTVFDGQISVQLEVRHPFVVISQLVRFLISKPVREIWLMEAQESHANE